MSGIPNLPVTILASIRGGSVTVSRYFTNPSSPYNGYPYEFDVTIDILTLSNSEGPNFEFNANDLVPGMWLLQQSGLTYEIKSITVINNTEAQVTLKDLDLYNIHADPTQSGNNYPQENEYGVTFKLSENGYVTMAQLQTLSANLPSVAPYWINSVYARFEYRNLYLSHYNFNRDSTSYSSLNPGQVVYVNPVGPTFIPVDDSLQSEVEKAFGVVSSVNEPEVGNLTVRPFGRIITVEYDLPGDVGDVLYYNDLILSD